MPETSRAQKARSAIDDVRALGSGVFIRAGYEGSKRFGGHDLIFGGLTRRRPTTQIEVPLAACPGPIPVAAATRAAEEADRIADGVVTIFGRQMAIGPDPDWHALLEGPGSWPSIPWWRIDIRSNHRIGDAKWVWELGRHRHLVVLARAVRLDPTDSRISAVLVGQLRSWARQNPPERGLHWYSNLEISLRALAWLQVLALAGSSLPDDVTTSMAAHLHHAGRHLMADLPYTVSSMRNNHLLGDGLGLVALGRAFANRRQGRVWASVGDHIFVSQLRRHMRPDGSMIEDSLSYHRFVLEMLAARVLLGDPPEGVVDHLTAAGRFLGRMGAEAGPLPQYGDWDEGRVLAGSGPPSDMRGSVRLALALGGSGASANWREEHDEACWYAPEGQPAPPDDAIDDGGQVGGGFARAARGGVTAWLKAGGGTSHGHADYCSTVIAVDRRWVVGDPGTGTYNGPADQRDHFRSSVAHSVLRLGGANQLEPHRAFRWRNSANGRVGPALRHPHGVVMWGMHDAYQRLEPPRFVVRTVALDGTSVVVADWVSGPPGVSFELSIPLAPGAEWEAGQVTLADGSTRGLFVPGTVSAVCGQDDPYDGWWSDTYGHARPTSRLEATGVVDGPVAWQLSEPDSPRLELDGRTLRIGSVCHTVRWTSTVVELVVCEGDIEQSAFLPLPD